MSEKDSTTMNTLNLFQLKERMEESVFNYIDTIQKWEQAYASLDELVTISVKYFDDYMKMNGEIPKGNTFWVLFMSVASKLIYFHTIAYFHLKGNERAEIQKEVLELLTIAANCIPEVQKEANVEFLKEIAISYEEIALNNVKKGHFEKIILTQNNRIKDCLNNFTEFTKLIL